ncbi:MAG: GNAT family N-acetyltransferase [Planctomycetota bacterium]
MHGLTTERLTIRRFTPDDLAGVAELLDGCFGDEPLKERERWLDWTVRNYVALEALHQPPFGDYAVVCGARLVGSIGLVPSLAPFGRLPTLGGDPSANHTPELGLFWATHPEHRRRGYATEAAAAALRFVFGQLHAARVVATTEHDNVASMAVMRKLGMTIDRNPINDPPWFQTVGVVFTDQPSG